MATSNVTTASKQANSWQFTCNYTYSSGRKCDDENLHRRYKDPHNHTAETSLCCDRTGCDLAARSDQIYITIRAIDLYKKFCDKHWLEESYAQRMYNIGL